MPPYIHGDRSVPADVITYRYCFVLYVLDLHRTRTDVVGVGTRIVGRDLQLHGLRSAKPSVNRGRPSFYLGRSSVSAPQGGGQGSKSGLQELQISWGAI